MVSSCVIIPVKNGGERLERVLRAVAEQEGVSAPEIVVVDSGSADGSQDVALRAGARLIPIAPAEFQHGATRNLGAAGARAEVLLFLNQDAMPVGSGWLRQMIEDLQADPRRAGVCARLVPRPECDPLSARDILHEFGLTVRDWRGAGGARVAEDPTTDFHSVSCAIRAEAFRQTPFAEVAFGEDRLWAQEIRQCGWTTGLSSARVEHSHALRMTPLGLAAIHADSTYFNHQLEPIPLRRVLRWWIGAPALDAAFIARLPHLSFGSKLRWMAASPYVRTCQTAGRLCGVWRNLLPRALRSRVFVYQK